MVKKNITKRSLFSIDFYYGLILFIISTFLVFDLFINKGQPATFDGWTHLTNIAMFNKSLKMGEFPVRWTDGFANYGMPLGSLAQQTTSYLGGVINLLTNNVLLSYNLVLAIGAILSTLLFYFFLRKYFRPVSSFAAAFLFNFAPYRIINVYIRGAIPEFFGSVFLPLILLGIYYFLVEKKYLGLILVSTATALTILTHPFLIVIYGFIIAPYIFFNLLGDRKWRRSAFFLAGSFALGAMLAGYFIIPLVLENKYFYYGLSKNHFVPGHFLIWQNFFDPRWFYFYKNDIFTRGHFMKTGVLEILLLVTGYLSFVRGKLKNDKLVKTVLASSILIVFFLIKPSEFIYKNVDFISNIQHPWRMLSAFIFLPPIVLAFLLNRFNKNIIIYSLLIIICLIRFPQLYGKNYTFRPESDYFFTKENLHGQILNTIWTGPAESYPVKKTKGEIIEGKGKIVKAEVKNNWRRYLVEGENDLRLADNTFYFPGWRAYVDGKETEIQFQDPFYRGVITYKVPKGEHEILVKFTNTKVRWLGIFVSIASSVGLLIIVFLNQISKIDLKRIGNAIFSQRESPPSRFHREGPPRK